MRRIVNDRVKNMRDLGGYPTLNGRETRFGSFIRSNLPTGMSNEEIYRLLKMGLSTVIDLRTEIEAKRKPNILNIRGINYFNISIGAGFPQREEDIPNCYMDIVLNRDKMRLVFEVMINSQGMVLFNCTAGKDRTGVIAMLLLKLAGVYDDDILADYEVSYTYLRDEIRLMHVNNPDLPAFFGGSKMENMEKFLNLFNSRFNSIDDYFDYLGINRDDISVLRERIVL